MTISNCTVSGTIADASTEQKAHTGAIIGGGQATSEHNIVVILSGNSSTATSSSNYFNEVTSLEYTIPNEKTATAENNFLAKLGVYDKYVG